MLGASSSPEKVSRSLRCGPRLQSLDDHRSFPRDRARNADLSWSSPARSYRRPSRARSRPIDWDPECRSRSESSTLVGDPGTYIDAPFRFHADRADVARLPLERVVNVPIVMIRMRGRSEVSARRSWANGTGSGAAPYLCTRAGRATGAPIDTGTSTALTCASTRSTPSLMRKCGAIVGIDSLNVDDPTDNDRPAHDHLLGADIPIIEHLTNLHAVPDAGARLTALPAPVRGVASFPVRAVAVYENS